MGCENLAYTRYTISVREDKPILTQIIEVVQLEEEPIGGGCAWDQIREEQEKLARWLLAGSERVRAEEGVEVELTEDVVKQLLEGLEGDEAAEAIRTAMRRSRNVVKVESQVVIYDFRGRSIGEVAEILEESAPTVLSREQIGPSEEVVFEAAKLRLSNGVDAYVVDLTKELSGLIRQAGV